LDVGFYELSTTDLRGVAQLTGLKHLLLWDMRQLTDPTLLELTPLTGLTALAVVDAFEEHQDTQAKFLEVKNEVRVPDQDFGKVDMTRVRLCLAVDLQMHYSLPVNSRAVGLLLTCASK
jgi:hypothetical protein